MGKALTLVIVGILIALQECRLITETVNLKCGETRTLQCTSEDDTVYWFRNGIFYRSRSSEEGHALQLESVAARDEGVYKCVSASEGTLNTYNVIIQEKHDLKMDINETPFAVNEGQGLARRTNLTCKVYGGPAETVKWKFNDTITIAEWTHARSRRDVKQRMRSFRFPPFRMFDFYILDSMRDISEYEKMYTLTINLLPSKTFLLGDYTCIAKREGEEISKTYKLV